MGLGEILWSAMICCSVPRKKITEEKVDLSKDQGFQRAHEFLPSRSRHDGVAMHMTVGLALSAAIGPYRLALP